MVVAGPDPAIARCSPIRIACDFVLEYVIMYFVVDKDFHYSVL